MLDEKIIAKYTRPLLPIPTNLKQTGNLKRKIQCVLFDIYGTLFVSGSGDISIAKKQSLETSKLKELFRKFEIDKNPEVVLKSFFDAIEKQHIEMKKQRVDFPEIEVDQIWMDVLENKDLDSVRKFAVEFELIVNPVYPMPDLQKILSSLKNKNILMGIISNAQFYTPYLFDWFLHSNLEELGFSQNLIFFSYKLKHAKPSALMFQKAAKELEAMNIPAHSTLYVGNDMLKDIYPAKKAGFQTDLFAGDKRSLRMRENNPLCKNISADIIVTNLTQLLKHVN